MRAFVGDDPSGRKIKRVVFSGFFRPEALAFIQALDALYEKRIRRSALLVIDIIETFVGDGSIISSDEADRLCGGINSLVETAAAYSVPIIYVKDAHSPSDRESFYAHTHGLEPPDRIGFHRKLKVLGEPGATTLVKNTYSAFFGTTLERLLKDRGVETLIFTGTQTHVCVSQRRCT